MPHTLSATKRLTISEMIETPRDQWHRGRRVPMLRMRGSWLEENGFAAGERVTVTVEHGRIVITLANEA